MEQTTLQTQCKKFYFISFVLFHLTRKTLANRSTRYHQINNKN